MLPLTKPTKYALCREKCLQYLSILYNMSTSTQDTYKIQNPKSKSRPTNCQLKLTSKWS